MWQITKKKSQFTIVCLIRLDALYPSGSMDEKHTNGNWEKKKNSNWWI